MKRRTGTLLILFLISFQVHGESFRALIAGINRVSLSDLEGVTVPLSYVSSSLIRTEGDTRFFRGIQLELTAPPNYLAYRGSLAAVLYGELKRTSGAGTGTAISNTGTADTGIVDLDGRRLGFDPLPAKIQTIYQLPLKTAHGLKTTPYATVLTGIIPLSSFPLLFRIMPVIKGISDEMENMVFNLNVKPILSDEGALRITFRYPENLQGRSLTVMVDDEVVANPGEERLLKEGEHHLVIQSDNYRNQSSRFVVERAKILDLYVDLQDPTPILIFEYPEETKVYLDNVFIPNPRTPRPVDPGLHEVRFQVGDYTITRPLFVQKGKTYRVALSVDMDVAESE